MVIVHRDYNEVRWLLDFYRDRMYPFPLGLLTLLSQPATGAFFDRQTGDIYFGSTPLQFSVCSNDQEIFKLVYSCCAGVDGRSQVVMKETESGKIIDSAPESSKEQPWSHNFGAYAVFQTDSEGNNALHLCALHGLSDMYQCVYDTALSLVSRELKNEYVKKSSINPSKNKHVTIQLNDKILIKNCATMRLKDISIPIDCNDLDKRIDAEAQKIVDCKLVLALNRDLHSPLTLTAATMVKPPRHDILNSDDDSSDENNPSNKYHKKVDMFRILLQKLKKRQWSYGPISLYYLTLDGVAMNYKVKERYEVATDDDHQRRLFTDQLKNSSADQQTTISSLWKMLTHCFDGNVNAFSGSRLKNNRMLPAIAWLCVNETEKAILIPEVVEIIETKWRLMAYPTFLSSFILHLMLTLMITVALCLMNSTSTLNFGSDYSLDIIISIILIIIGATYLFLIVKQFNAFLRRGRDFFDLRGICLFDRRMRFVKIGSFVSFCICKYLVIRERYYRDYLSSPYGIAIYYDREYQEGAMISLAICAMVSWLHLYFFLMGFDGTGPLTLTIFRLCTVDVPYFLKFYCVVILSYASALGVLAMSGMSEQGPTFGFMFILRSIGSLMQVTVGVDPTKDVLNIQTAFSSEFFWLAELLLSSYNAVVLILMINLLIAIISQTFDRYFNKSYPLLLMAKYDIMHAMEKSMGIKELNETSEKYAASDDAANQDFARDDDDRLKGAQIKSFKFQMKEHNTNWYYSGPQASAKKSMKNALLIIGAACYHIAIVSYHNQRLTHLSYHILDAQNDFHEGGLLPINGATEDSRRIAELIRKFGSNIHEIYVSLSTYHPKHIANASCWRRGAKMSTDFEQLNSIDNDGYEEGDHPRPFTEISYQDIRAGTWLYEFKDLRSVEMTNKFRIQVLPEHCIVGTRGQCLHPFIHDAIQVWAQRCSRNVHYIFKGHHLFIEVRSALCHPLDPNASHDEDLLAKLKMNDKVRA
jgi:nicotinamidase/pyrazinamidase